MLAESDAGIEAFCCASSLGLQFHPEVTPAIIADWIRAEGKAIDSHGVCFQEILALSEASAVSARVRAYNLLDAFAREHCAELLSHGQAERLRQRLTRHAITTDHSAVPPRPVAAKPLE